MCASLPSSIRESRKRREFWLISSSKLVLLSLSYRLAEQDGCLFKDYGAECPLQYLTFPYQVTTTIQLLEIQETGDTFGSGERVIKYY